MTSPEKNSSGPLWQWLRSVYGLDTRSLAVFRIFLGLILVYDFAMRSVSVKSHYSDLGILPRQSFFAMMEHAVDMSLLWATGDTAAIAAFFLIGIAASLLFTIGYHTKISGAIAWLFLISVQNRNPLILQSGDHLLKMVLLWALFLPLSRHFSLGTPSEKPKSVFNMAAVALVVQLAILYVFAGFFKVAERHWLAGDGLFLSLAGRDMNTGLAAWIVRHVPLEGMNFATLVFECFVPLFLFLPWKNNWIRFALALFFIGFHAGIFLTLKVGIFVFVPIAAWCALIPAEAWSRFAVLRKLENILVETFAVLSTKIRVPTLPDIRLPYASKAATAAVSIGLVTVVAFNLTTLPGVAIPFPNILRVPLNVLALRQSYGMFAVTVTRSGFIWIPAQLNNGEKIELSVDGQQRPFRNVPPDLDLYNQYDDRWGKMVESYLGGFWRLRGEFGRYLCRQWNDAHAANERLDTFKLLFVTKSVDDNANFADEDVEHLWTHECTDGAADRWVKDFDCTLKGVECPNTP